MEPIKWPNQFAHFLFSAFVMVGRVVWFPANIRVTMGLVIGLIVYALCKEFIWDLHVEKSQDEDGAGVDALFYILGTMATFVALFCTNKL